jgi:signal transduction histidine kinase
MANFTVDTHLFRELGEFLVGRPSTALVELIKNAYDADALEVTVYGESLKSPDTGRIVITDTGNGMTEEEFKQGFLRVASRLKEEGNRRSPVYGRKYTGAKGVGRLAAHKLARSLRVESIPRATEESCVVATIDWDMIEQCETLDQVEKTSAVSMKTVPRASGAKNGTTITLERLRYKWTDSEFTRLFREITGFLAPIDLLKTPENLVGQNQSVIEDIEPADVERSKGAMFNCQLQGDFDAGVTYFDAVATAADWVLEVDANRRGRVRYAVLPTKRLKGELKDQGVASRAFHVETPHPNPRSGPFFQSRILIRDGTGTLGKDAKGWATENAGVRVYFEGFRVLPYGEKADDWLSIDADVSRRDRALQMLERVAGAPPAEDDEGLSRRKKDAYFGGVFLKQSGACDLKMVVNREGFIPTQSYEDMVRLIRTGIDLSVRARAAVRAPLRKQRAAERSDNRGSRLELRAAVEHAVARANLLAREAREFAASGDYNRASELITEAARTFAEGAGVSERLVTERETMQILASLGLHMTAFVHEVRGLLGMARALDETLSKLRERSDLAGDARKAIAGVHGSVTELRRVVERQAAYLTDVTSPDARRRRSRQKLANRFDVALKLFAPQLERLGIKVRNSIPKDLKVAPMFPAELTLILTNLLSNAIKAAREQGSIAVSAIIDDDGSTRFRLENTGVAVDLDEAERWFLPFETTTAELDPSLGQGMGMGLTITRNLLEEYGAKIVFVKPHGGMSTAIEIHFPN